MIPPGTPRDDVIIVQSVKILDLMSPLVMQARVSRLYMLNQLAGEALADVPDADFIEIRAVRYDVKEDTGERSAKPVPDPE